MNKIKFFATAIALFVLVFNVTAQSDMTSDGVTVIELTQIDGAFETEELILKPGKYQFKVTNKTVDHEVGFVIQAAKDKEGDVMKTAVAESFAQSLIKKGSTSSTGVVELKAGEYVYSCPLNPTPKYPIVVK